ncbi:Protein of unknown function DUF1264 [Cynara cardunculus var. scolymus]|uniref:Uncharacterized protein n=1 Tax=Cynara cardunculus var. scolymus TaxID=59895 RepID=A0A103XEZ1_CYNCS|nr:Protein of unknown function DUF1264 [Cynara cardunculus var. scolymus]
MASSDKAPDVMPVGDGSVPPGKPMTVGQQVIDKSSQLMQTLKPIKNMSLHVCTFALYGHDMSRQIETHHYVTRLNQDFLQCAVYDSDDPSARLIGVEYIVSDRIFDTLATDEQKLWHSHDHEVTSGLWINPGDRLPLGAPALMMSPQLVNMGVIKPDLVKLRDNKYKISTDELRASRANIPVSKPGIARASDYWMQTGKGFAVDIKPAEMKSVGGVVLPNLV